MKRYWNEERIRLGFEAYLAQHGRYPYFPEIDGFAELPCIRTIQRTFGGFKGIQERLGITLISHHEGTVRSQISKDIGQRGYKYERALESILVERFGKYFVHTQKPMQNSRKRADFHVYAQNYEFDVDIFYAKDFRSFTSNIIIKTSTLKNLTHDIYLVCANEKITRENINTYITKSRKTSLDDRIKIFSYSGFLDHLRQFQPIKIIEDTSQNL